MKMKHAATMASIVALCSTASIAYQDSLIETADDSVTRINRADGLTVYVFTNAALGEVTVNPVMPLRIEEALVVGGGGAGGGTIGGGGGGGGVETNDGEIVTFEPFTVTVGAGGRYTNTDTWRTGESGSPSTLSIGSTDITAYGGGFGGGWNAGNGAGTSASAQLATGGGGASSSGKGGAGMNGNNGGNALACGGNDNAPGGGGGAGGPGQSGQSDKHAGVGGPGVLSAITGEELDYGAGGGGGGGNAVVCSEGGGAGAGNGTPVNSNRPGLPGLDGRGGGGGGGSYNPGCKGGDGGGGAVILALSVAESVTPVASASVSVPSTDTATFDVLVTIVGTDAESATAAISYAPHGEALPAPSVFATSLADRSTCATTLTGLSANTVYDYEITVENDKGENTVVAGTFDTSDALFCYVDGEGNDSFGNGSQSSPFRTLTRALSSVRAGRTVRVGAGTYDASAGELFPILVTNAVSVVGYDAGSAVDPADIVVDGGNGVPYLLVYSNSTDFATVSGMTLRESTSAALYLHDANCLITNCVFTQGASNRNPGGLWVHNASKADVRGCEFTGMNRYGAIRVSGADDIDRTRYLDVRDTLFADNNSSYGTIAARERCFFTIRLADCTFTNNTTAGGGLGDSAPASLLHLAGTYNAYYSSCQIDRCRFLGNSGQVLIGQEYMNYININDSLFAGNHPACGSFSGHSGNRKVLTARNCTFVDETGGFALRNTLGSYYNCIFAGVEAMQTSNAKSGWASSPDYLYLYDAILWNCGLGLGYNAASTNVKTDVDPVLENISVPWNDPAFDARPRPYSPAIDAGANANVAATSATDIDGNARIADNTDSATATVDLGCYESLFHANVAPTFFVPAPGKMGGFRGVTYSIPVSISPAATGPVAAAVTYSEGLSGDATLAFEDGAASATLSFTLAASSTNEMGRITISESGTSLGVAPAVFDVFIDDVTVAVASTRLLVHTGDTFDLPVRIALDGATAPADIPIAIDSVSGSANTVSWQGDAFIAEGGTVSGGALHIVAGEGISTVRLVADAVFAETGSDYVDITVVGYPGHMYVDPDDGDDAIGTGFIDAPFKSITAALRSVVDGDEIRILPGTCDSESGEVFPLAPHGVALVGWSDDGAPATNAASVTISAADAAESIASYDAESASVTGRISNVTLRDTTGAAIVVSGADAVFSNVVFRQSTALGAPGGIWSRNVSRVTAYDCDFSGMSRQAAVYITASDDDNLNRYVHLYRCSFRDNNSAYGTVAVYPRCSANLVIEDTDFIGNTTASGTLDDAQPSSVVFFAGTYNGYRSHVRLDRCRIFGNTGCMLFGYAYNNDFVVANTLMADNAPTSFTAASSGGGLNFRNCTFVREKGALAGFRTPTYCYNCVFYNTGALSANVEGSRYGTSLGTVNLGKCAVYGTELGDGPLSYNADNLITGDPLLKNAGVPWNDAAFDARPRSASPVIDAGDNAQASGEFDIAFGARVRAARPDRSAVVDLGCYETDIPDSGTVLFIR